MGNLCSGPQDLESSERPLKFESIRGGNGTEMQKQKSRSESIIPGLSEQSSRPRVHRNRGPELKKDASAFGVKERSIPLKDCSDEVLLAELEHRNIRLHDRVTESIVLQRYKVHSGSIWGCHARALARCGTDG